MRKRRIWRYWLLGATLTFALFVVLYFISNFRYENSDDALLLKAFMGFEGGTPTNFTLYTHTVLAWLLYGLNLWLPTIPWFSFFQLGVLFFSGMVLVKSLLQLTRRHRYPLLTGLLAGGLFLAVFAAFAYCRITYTTTAALAGAAAVAQVLTVDLTGAKGKTIVRAYLLSLFLLAGAYCLRDISVLPPLAFMGLASLWRLAEKKKSYPDAPSVLRPMLAVLAMFVLTFGVLIGIRQVEIGTRGLRPYVDWQMARIELMDYTNFQNNPRPALQADSGLSTAEVSMVRQWYFLDSGVDEQALNTMAEAYDTDNPADALNRLTSFFSQDQRYKYIAVMFLLLCGLCWTGKRKRAPLAAAAATIGLAGALILFVYLVWRGRLIARAADTVVMPCAALLSGLALLKGANAPDDEPRRNGRRILAFALSLLLLVAGVMNTRLVYDSITRAPDTVSMQREAELEEYALQNPDTLIVRSPDLLRDTRLFPDVSAGVPANIILWGDWGCRTPNWYSQLARYGFDGENFTAADWLKENIVFAAARTRDAEILRAYLTDTLGEAVDAIPYETWGTLRFYCFRISAT